MKLGLLLFPVKRGAGGAGERSKWPRAVVTFRRTRCQTLMLLH